MSSIIFVDDEPSVLAGLRRMLHRERNHWRMYFLDNGAAALSQIALSPVDVVVSDMRMPVMDGAELLARTRQQAPATVRVGLSGYSESGRVLRGLDSIHQFLAKPCDSRRLLDALGAIFRAKETLSLEVQSAVAGLPALACQPAALRALETEIAREVPAMEKVAAIVASDLGLSTKTLQLVYSEFFGQTGPVSSANNACKLLGANRFRELLRQPTCFPVLPELDPPWLAKLASQASAVGRLAGDLARVAGLPENTCEQVRMAGSLHNVDQLVLASANGSVGKPESGGGDAGAYLLTLWGFPAPVAEAVAHYREPSRVTHRTLAPVSFVHLASRLMQSVLPTGNILDLVDRDYFVELGAAQTLPLWVEQARTQPLGAL